MARDVQIEPAASRSARSGLALAGALALSTARAATFMEDFATDPAARGWQVFGNTNLFQWDSENHNLRVTFDSSQTNSYFFHPLGTILTRDDDFHVSFDLTFDDYVSGVTPDKPNAMPAAVGLLNVVQAFQTNFLRGTGVNSSYGPKNLVEFDFFPAFDIFLPTIAQVVVSTNNAWLYNHDNLLDLTPGEVFHVQMDYLAATHTLTTVVLDHGVLYGVPQVILVTANNDFRVGTFSISSYSDRLSRDSILAHGVVDNVTVTVPPPPVENLSLRWSNGVAQARFAGQSNWLYTLERTTDFASWTDAASVIIAGSTNVILLDTQAPAGGASYRVRAERP